MRLLLAPHAETDWNAKDRFQGHTDTSLSERGRWQAQILQEHLAEEPLQAIVASDLRRALETAEILALPHGLCVQAESRLRELHFGDWEGRTYAEVQASAADALADWQNDPLTASPPNGERLIDLQHRLQGFLRDLTDVAPTATVLLVAHRGSLRVLLCLLLARPVEKHWDFRLDPASVSEVTIVGGRTELVRLNEIPLESEVAHAG
jgi:broad specificity phosphatase PhoE